MQKWEYHYDYVNGLSESIVVTPKGIPPEMEPFPLNLNLYLMGKGQEGWELVSIALQKPADPSQGYVLIFKRPKE